MALAPHRFGGEGGVMGWVVWPEGKPEMAVFCNTRWAKAWRCFALGIRTFRRVCVAFPVAMKAHPIVAARACERVMRRA